MTLARVRQLLLPGMLLALLVLAPTALAQGARTPAPPVLGSSVTVSGTGASFATVRVSGRLDLSKAGTPVVRASDPSSFDGLVLVRVMPGSAAPGVAVLGLHSSGKLTTGFVFFGTDDGDQVSGTPVFAERVLDPGTYRLVLLSRGPNTVTLSVPGGRGRPTTVRATTPTRYDAQEVAGTGVPGMVVAPAVTAATTFTSRTRPLQLALAQMTSTGAASRFHACATQDPDGIDQALAGTPYCLAMAGINSLAPGVDRPETYQAFFQPAPGTWQFKGVVAAAGAATAGTVVSLQLELGPGFPLT